MSKQKMLSASKIPMQDFLRDLRYRQQKVWREADALSPREDLDKGVMRNVSKFRLHAYCLKVESFAMRCVSCAENTKTVMTRVCCAESMLQ
eukprot:1150332-Pelagomonas_calceolata.AAC.1